ncbi:hypothetical protein P20652_2227 [Pseudoalteromonas sp. BSi20652]|uniref:hypothetical protein n=1 Tax=Pseudoalteromonas sp. BSi20652 TaxID=388384 RepID=UPI0002316ACF|nr:hypothetical protein [Pseudoalteromonas sp. BSi20652]GAA60361.1 hypothetical protein P20652_2227 [Pseudoalteromonas sp. BSi20652]
MTKSNRLLKLTATVLLIVSQHSFADETCTLAAKATTDEAKRYIQCLDTQINKAKLVQGSWIQKRKYELTTSQESTGNTQVLPLFMRSISNNEKYLESACQWRYLIKLPNATAAAISYKLCEIKLINQFTESLKQPF